MGSLKLNFDGISKGNSGQAGFDCVIRSHSRNEIQAFVGFWGCVILLEQRLPLKGLRELKRMDVKGDSSVVISWGLGMGAKIFVGHLSFSYC